TARRAPALNAALLDPDSGVILRTKELIDASAPLDSLGVRSRLVEALKFDLVGPWVGHPLAEERLPGTVRPSTWYMTGFLIPSGPPPERSSDAGENDDRESIPAAAGLVEESNEERKAAKRSFFPASMGLSFLVPAAADLVVLTATWGDYSLIEA